MKPFKNICVLKQVKKYGELGHDSQRLCRKYSMPASLIVCFIIIFLLNSIAAGSIYASLRTGNSSAGKEASLKAKDINGKTVDISKKINQTVLLLFFDSRKTVHKGPLAYAQVLLDKFGEKNLYVVGITKSEYISENLISTINYPLVLDPEGRIHTSFNIRDCCGGTVLIKKGGTLKFCRSTLLNANNLRQLVEKAILGKIAYHLNPPLPQTILVQGHDVPEIELTDPYSMQVKNLKDFTSKKTIATFFSSFCSMCKSSKRVETLIRLRDAIGRNKNDCKIILIFSKPYDLADIDEWESHIEIPFDKYISADIFSDEEKYVTDDALKTNPLTVVLYRNQKVVFVEKSGMTEEQVMSGIAQSIRSTKKEDKK